MAAKKVQKKDSIYIVISYFDAAMLIAEVNKLLAEGYTLVGGIDTVIAPNHQFKVLYTQALILNN